MHATKLKKIHMPLFTIAVILCTGMLILLPGVNWADEKASHAGKQGAIGKGPRPGLKPVDQNGGMQISEADRCPVCAMRPIRYPKFSCAIQLSDGRTFYFCGTGCMIRSWMHPEVFLGADKSELSLPVVREYFTGRQMDARELEWVSGSDIIGPMGPALVPVQGKKEVETFKIRHGGKAVFTLEEMNDERWWEITGKRP